LEHIADLYPGVRITQDYDDLLDSDLDAIIVATPVSTHHRLTLKALRAGKHVLVEKPITASVQQAEEIVYEAERLDRVVMVGHTFEYNPAVVAMKEIITRGDLGTIYYISATRVNLGLFQPDINVVWDLAPHDVSILNFVMGKNPTAVSSLGGVYVQRETGIHDVAFLTLYYPNRALANIRVSWLDPCKIRRYTVVGSKKMLVYDDIEPEDKLLIYDKGVDVPPYSDTVKEFHLSYRHGEPVSYPVEWVEPLRAECQHFVDCISNGTKSRSCCENGLNVVKVLEAAQRSLLNGGMREAIL
jgi:predicted dehydrogenase